MDINPNSKRDMEKLSNDSTDMSTFLTMGPEGGVYIISEKKGSIALATPVIIKIPWRDYMQAVGMTVANICGLDIQGGRKERVM